MAVAHSALLSLLLTALTLTSYHRYGSRERATSSVSEERGDHDGNLTVYAMAVGQGDGNIILCPNGRDLIIVDMGAVPAYMYAKSSYGRYLLENRFNVVGNNMRIHIVVTHPDEDHFNFLQHSIDSLTLGLISEIVLGGKFEEYLLSYQFQLKTHKFKDWIRDNEAILPVYIVNNGSECFGNSNCTLTPVTPAAKEKDKKYAVAGSNRWQFCGDGVNITVLGANIFAPSKRSKKIGVSKPRKNEESVILKVAYKQWSLFLSGDFEGVRQQKKLLSHWPPSTLQSTYYKVAHHGAWTNLNQANIPDLLRAIRPRRAYVSQAHPLVTAITMHPKCQVIDNLINLKSIEKIDSSNYIACYRNTRKKNITYGPIEQILGYAIYETCRYYNYSSGCQICQDIEIMTDGYSDYTTYRSVPDEYVNPTKKNCWKSLKA